MDCRAKPGNDLLRRGATPSEFMRGLDPRIHDFLVAGIHVFSLLIRTYDTPVHEHSSKRTMSQFCIIRAPNLNFSFLS